MIAVLVAAALNLLAAAPSPCPSATPAAPVGRATPAPCPAPTAKLTEIGRSGTAVGRATNLVGTATAASEGTINQEQIADRPILRPGEVLEEIPGVVISQHSGEGKANQYYLRGFQLDHGTDLGRHDRPASPSTCPRTRTVRATPTSIG